MKEIVGVIKSRLHHDTNHIISNEWDIHAINIWRELLHQLDLIGENPQRYLGCGYGNISQRHKNSSFIISSTQTGRLRQLSKIHYCLVTETHLIKNTLYSTGSCKPS